jgi:hypothetical protein
MRILYNALTAALLMGAALGIAWALRPTSMPVMPHYGPVATPYNTATWTPGPVPGHMP